MITKTYQGITFPDESEDFYIIGKSFNAILYELKEYAEEHPEKWIYYYTDHQLRPSKENYRPEMNMEVCVRDERPAGIMMFYQLYQDGCEHKYEELTSDMAKKQMEFFAMLGSMISK